MAIAVVMLLLLALLLWALLSDPEAERYDSFSRQIKQVYRDQFPDE